MIRATSTLTRFALAGALFAAAAAGQAQVYVVDEANGPGTNFTDLPAAVAAADPGDIVVVRAGSYTAIVVNEGISILGQPGAALARSLALGQSALIVENLPAGQHFSCSEIGFASANPFLTLRAEVRNCQGSVHLEGLTIDAGGGSFLGGAINPALLVEGSPNVQVTASRLTGVPGIHASASRLVVTDSECLGSNGFAGHGETPSGNGVSAENSEVVLSRCRVVGGSFPLFPPTFVETGTALKSTASSWTLLGDDTTELRAGDPATGQPLDAVVGTGTVRYNPALNFSGFNGGNAFASNIQATAVELPSLSATGASLGGTVQLDLFGTAGASYALFVGLPGPPIPLGPIGELWMDPLLGPIFFVGGVLPPGRHAGASAPVPTDALILAARFTWQGLSFDPATGELFLSNPASYVHD